MKMHIARRLVGFPANNRGGGALFTTLVALRPIGAKSLRTQISCARISSQHLHQSTIALLEGGR
jgi:hypothetical protein